MMNRNTSKTEPEFNREAIVIGVNGQDGSYLAELLLDLGYQVAGVTRRSSTDTSGRLWKVLDNPSFRLVEGDVADPWSMSDIISSSISDSPEVYNLAAQSHVGTSFKQPALTWAVTAGGCMNILEAIRRYRPKARFYQASSSEMFGTRLSSRFIDGREEFYQDENTGFHPESPYAIAKLAAHQTVGLYRKAYGLHASAGILMNHESPRRGNEFVTQKICKYIGLLYNEYGIFELGCSHPTFNMSVIPKLRLGNLDASRDWGHARDYVRAMWLMLQQDKADDYVIATGETHTVKEFLEEAFRCIGIENWEPFVEIDSTLLRPSEVPYLRGNYAKANKALGWAPETSFLQLVREMVDGQI